MPIVFELKSKPNLPLGVRALTPGEIEGLTPNQIGELQIEFGNRTTPVSRWFRVSDDSNGKEVIFKGSLEQVHNIGHSMTAGRIEVHGSVGRHVGASMSGGEIIVHGNADDFLGYEMQGGTIAVHGNAADHVGGCYPGSKYGMNRGTILISGSAGKGLGYRMRRGTIAVGGDAGEFTAWQMRAGTIMVFGRCNGPVGIDMRRGTIVVGQAIETAATFDKGPQSSSMILTMLGQWLTGVASNHEIEFPKVDFERLQAWHGDVLAGGRGELFSTQR